MRSKLAISALSLRPLRLELLCLPKSPHSGTSAGRITAYHRRNVPAIPVSPSADGTRLTLPPRRSRHMLNPLRWLSPDRGRSTARGKVIE